MVQLVAIDSIDDARIAPYRLIRDRDLAGHGPYFIAEGEVVLNVLLRTSRLKASSLLIAESRIEKLGELLAGAPPDMPVYVAGQAVLDQIAGFNMHRGILGLGLRPHLLSPAELLQKVPEGAPVVVAIGIANHDNIGGIFRNAAAFGAGAVLLDETTVDPLYRKAIRVSVGGVLKVPFSRAGSGLALLDALDGAGFTSLALSPGATDELGSMALPARTALLLGTEGPGLPDAILSRAHKVKIAMRADFDSLNVATTSGIALYLATRRANVTP